MVTLNFISFHFMSLISFQKKPSKNLQSHWSLDCRYGRSFRHSNVCTSSCSVLDTLDISIIATWLRSWGSKRPALEAKTPWCNLWSMNRKSKIVPKKIGTFLEHLANVVIEIADLKHLINDMTENPVKTWISGSFVVCTQRYGTAKPCTFCMSGLPGAGKCDTVCFFHL